MKKVKIRKGVLYVSSNGRATRDNRIAWAWYRAGDTVSVLINGYAKMRVRWLAGGGFQFFGGC